jgi:hypothetical protein
LRYALVRAVLDWYRTGISRPLSVDDALALVAATTDEDPPERAEIDDALGWALEPIIGGQGRKTRQTLVTRHHSQGLLINDYLTYISG